MQALSQTSPQPNPPTLQPPPMPPGGAAPAASGLSPIHAPVSLDPFHVSEDDRTMGMLVHLLALLTGIIGVLILWLVKKDQSRFVDHHGREALNFQLTLLLASFAAMMIGVVTVIGLFVVIPLIWGVGIAALVMEIMACLSANRGEWHRYPVAIRFIGDR